MKGGYSRKSVLTGITSFLIVLFTMPLGHALMIFMEHVFSSTALHYAASLPIIGEGTHIRYVVDRNKFMEKLASR